MDINIMRFLIILKKIWNVKSLEQYINFLHKNTLPLENNEILSEKDNFNEMIINGLRLKKGISISNLKKYNNFIDKLQLDRINNKWDCLTITNNNIRLTTKGLLFVDEISADMFI